MNTNDIREHLLEQAPWVDRETTVDTVKAGDPTHQIQTVGVGWISALESLKRAIELGCDLFITHEPTFWEHSPAEASHRETEPGRTKADLLEQSGLVVLRVHDIWDVWPEIGIRDSWAQGLGLTEFVGEDETRWHAAYDIPPTTLCGFAEHVAERIAPLGEDSLRVMGDPAMPVSRVAVGTGCGGPDVDMIALGAQALVVCYDGASYWRTRERLVELGAGVIVVEHSTSELWGMENLARYLDETFPVLTVRYIDRHPKPWTVMPGCETKEDA
jgi:putative NIF3 family GTP cyclohydrolase 1 type 2